MHHILLYEYGTSQFSIISPSTICSKQQEQLEQLFYHRNHAELSIAAALMAGNIERREKLSSKVCDATIQPQL